MAASNILIFKFILRSDLSSYQVIDKLEHQLLDETKFIIDDYSDSEISCRRIYRTDIVCSQRKHLSERIRECSKRIYKVPKFIFYARGYAIESVLSMDRKGIDDFLRKKSKITTAESV